QLLYLAAHEGEARVEQALRQLLEQRRLLSEQAVRTLLGEATPLREAAQVEVAAGDLGVYDALLEGSYDASDYGMSLPKQGREEKHEQGCDPGAGDLPAGAASAGGACPVRGGGPTGDCRDLELSGVSAGTAPAGVPATPAQTDRTAAEGSAAAPGEELGRARS